MSKLGTEEYEGDPPVALLGFKEMPSTEPVQWYIDVRIPNTSLPAAANFVLMPSSKARLDQ